MISPLLPPAFSPIVSTACVNFSCFCFQIPRQQITDHSRAEFYQNYIIMCKVPSPLFPFNQHGYMVLLIIKAQFLGIVQSELNSYPGCLTTLYSRVKL